MTSILDTTKKILGIESSYTGFDTDVILGINTALSTLKQLGIGPEEGFSVSDKNDTWEDFIEDATNLESIKSYVGLKTRLLFDPPSSSFVLDAFDRQLKELEWRLMVEVDPAPVPETPEEE